MAPGTDLLSVNRSLRHFGECPALFDREVVCAPQGVDPKECELIAVRLETSMREATRRLCGMIRGVWRPILLDVAK
jgi:hypothetical protein